MIADRLRAGLRMFRERLGTPTALVAAGGVAANQAIRKALHRVAFEAGTVLVAPPAALCTDNGAMIAWAGAERLALGLTDPLDVAPRARWPLERGDGAADTRPRRARRRASRRRTMPREVTAAEPHEPSTASRCSARARGALRWRNVIARAGRRVTLWEHDQAGAEALARRARARSCPACGSTSASPSAGGRRGGARTRRSCSWCRPSRCVRPPRARAGDRARHAGHRLRQGHRARHAASS